MEQRQYFRAKSNSTEVYISDKAGFCTGTLKDFSRFGLCITDIPRKIHPQNGHFTAIIAHNDMKFTLKVAERWSGRDGLTTEVGALIEDVPWDWTEMAMQHEPLTKDVWAATK
jgi:hypothetical protein